MEPIRTAAHTYIQGNGGVRVRKVWQILLAFGVMYLIATIVGFATYFLISPTAMWMCVFTLMPLVSAWLIYRYLRHRRCPPEDSLAETITLLLVWIGLSFGFDALTYIVIVPASLHTAPNWTFFHDQSPWVWLSYAVLLLSGYMGRWTYLRSIHA